MPQIDHRERKLLVRYRFKDMTTYTSTSNSGCDNMVAYALTIESLKLMEALESSQQAVTMNEDQMTSLDERKSGHQMQAVI